MNPPFTEAPSDPTYVVVGSDSRLEWNYDHGNVENIAIQYKKSGSFVALVFKDSKGSVQVNPQEPKSLTDRITIERNATLVIKAVNTGDSTKYRCEFTPVGGGSTTEGPVRLIVAGRYTTFLWQKSVHMYTYKGSPGLANPVVSYLTTVPRAGVLNYRNYHWPIGSCKDITT